ncbi:D-alanyl-D-alanine carboxypeptidase family protein [Cytobacillus praedii]|uniref:D-alanyl-D-alanine carboxypeptidase n=1 Tax=Cytobacillus praedii TaxID=1742358 RepID=A0A4R1AQV8_9BACI|nr:D-alanyl-D-alanine carboxypeptidase [Cytobacillus praedii]TCJ02373.1 D-alanyl-D-alanine carboxypeptidase [Cytobacillus praedii]
MRKNKRTYSTVWIIIFLIVLTIFFIPDEKFDGLIQDMLNNYTKEYPAESNSTIDDLYSQNAILINLDEEKILMEKQSEEIIFPASLTKIMTTLVAIENLADLQKRILLPASMFSDLYYANASMAGFLPNEKVAAIDLLYGTMLPSGAEASIGLANEIAGSETAFVELMNEKAKQIGMKDTHFTNATGLHHRNHYSSVKDISVLLEYALKNQTFRTIFTAERYSTAPSNLHPDGITFKSSMFKNLNSSNLMGEEIIGGKTGYTEQAGLCLASIAEINGQEYLLITAGANGNHQTEQYNITDAIEVYKQIRF